MPELRELDGVQLIASWDGVRCWATKAAQQPSQHRRGYQFSHSPPPIMISTSDKIAIVSVAVAALAITAPLVINHIYRRRDRRPNLTATVGPHTIMSGRTRSLIRGVAVTVTSHGILGVQLSNVRLRITGFDVTGDFMAGFSGTTPFKLSPHAKPSDTGVEIELLRSTPTGLVSSHAGGSTATLQQHQKEIYFTPLPIWPLEMQYILDSGIDNASVSVVAALDSEKNAVLISSEATANVLFESMLVQRGGMVVPDYTWHISAFAVTDKPLDTYAIGRLNDKSISLKAGRAAARSATVSVPPSMRQDDRARALRQEADVWGHPWRFEILPDTHLSIDLFFVVPNGLGCRYHPQEDAADPRIIQSVIKTVSQDLRNQQVVRYTMSKNNNEPPLSVTLSMLHSCCVAVFTHEDGQDVKHIHGVLAMLPRASAADDEAAMSHVQSFACLKDVSPRAFNRVLLHERGRAAMFYADIGSANCPLVLTMAKALCVAFPWKETAA